MSDRPAERTTDFLSALSRLKEVLAQPEDSFLRDASKKAVVYGSRASGAYRAYSDIDIAVMAPAMTDREFSMLWSALDDLPILFKLDVVHFERVGNPRLRANIAYEGVELYPGA